MRLRGSERPCTRLCRPRVRPRNPIPYARPCDQGPHSVPCAAQDPRRLEDLTGLTELHSSAAALAADFDDDQASDDDGTLL